MRRKKVSRHDSIVPHMIGVLASVPISTIDAGEREDALDRVIEACRNYRGVMERLRVLVQGKAHVDREFVTEFGGDIDEFNKEYGPVPRQGTSEKRKAKALADLVSKPSPKTLADNPMWADLPSQSSPTRKANTSEAADAERSVGRKVKT